MPITKFSFAMLREHLRKYLWVYIVGIAACLVGSSLLWTMTRPQLPYEQTVVIYLVDSYSNPDPMEDIAADMLERGQVYDPNLQEVTFYSLQYSTTDTTSDTTSIASTSDYYSSMLLMVRLSTGEADAFIASKDGLDALVNTGVVEPLDEAYADGFMAETGLEPIYCTIIEDEETEPDGHTVLAAFKLDDAYIDTLSEMGVFYNKEAYLVVACNGTNIDTTCKVLEYMIEDLQEVQFDVSTDGEAEEN